MDLVVVPLHKHPEYMEKCCKLINEEWKRSDTARLQSLKSSSDKLPTCLILLKSSDLIGHLKLSAIPSKPDSCFVESVVIDKNLRGNGYGSYLMREAEKYCANVLKLNSIHLSTKGQEKFYSKLGYEECGPVSIYGSFNSCSHVSDSIKKSSVSSSVHRSNGTPPPPPLPKTNVTTMNTKTFMVKFL